MKKIRVLLADDHTLVRAGLRLLLERGGGVHVVGEASNGREAVRLSKAACPDVVVMDLAMPELRGSPETLKRQWHSEIHVGRMERVCGASGEGG